VFFSLSYSIVHFVPVQVFPSLPQPRYPPVCVQRLSFNSVRVSSTFSRSTLLILPACIDNQRVVSLLLRVFRWLGGCNGRSSPLFYSSSFSTSSGTSSYGAFFSGTSFFSFPQYGTDVVGSAVSGSGINDERSDDEGSDDEDSAKKKKRS
jgi:hypothetical protein